MAKDMRHFLNNILVAKAFSAKAFSLHQLGKESIIEESATIYLLKPGVKQQSRTNCGIELNV